jgi:hypothetical protein
VKINTGLKRGKNSEDEPYDNESKKQVKRLQPEGKLYSHVEDLVNEWYLPLLEIFAGVMLPPAASKLMDEYRPLNNEEVINFHVYRVIFTHIVLLKSRQIVN